MPTARKETAVSELTEKLAGANNLFLTDYTGLTVDGDYASARRAS